MNHKISCEIIQDLMPMYVDELTSEVTNDEIREHLKECGSCRGLYERMKKEVEGENAEAGKVAGRKEKEIDYLKKVRKANRRNIVIGAAAVFLITILAVFAKLFVIGRPSDSYVVTYVDLYDSQIRVGGVFYDSASVYRGHKVVSRDDGTQELVVYTCLPSFWNREGAFNLDLDLPPEGSSMHIGEMTVKSDGAIISSLANNLYKARNPYIGDASADGKLAGTLGISKELGVFKNELQTSREPYGWTMKFEDSVSNSAVFEEKMKAYACVLTALTDNLGQVSWIYTVELESGPVERRGSMTEEACSRYVGAPVKSFGESPEGVQRLLDLLGIEE